MKKAYSAKVHLHLRVYGLSWISILLLAATLYSTARCSPAFAEWYSSQIFPLLTASFGRLTSLLPFSLAEVLGLLLALILPGYGIFSLLQLWRPLAQSFWKKLGKLLFFLLPVAALLFVLGEGIQYYRPPLEELSIYKELDPELPELEMLMELLVAEIETALPQVPADARGITQLPKDLPEKARLAMENLGLRDSRFTGYLVQPKGAWSSSLLSQIRFTGIYVPFTLEAHYNTDTPSYGRGATICHELAHALGYAREDEANFIAYLACHFSQDPDLAYSGALRSLVYCLNDYYDRVDAATYSRFYQALPERVRADLAANRDYWSAYQGKAAKVAQQANNAYLQANGVAAGTKSYNQVVQLLLGYYGQKE